MPIASSVSRLTRAAAALAVTAAVGGCTIPAAPTAGSRTTGANFSGASSHGRAPKSTAGARCHLRGALPDRACTPGVTDPRVTPATISSTICTTGYTSTVRPSTSVTGPLKLASIRAYGLPGSKGLYEYDHLISLELGGAPADPANLFPEPYAGTAGARVKDRAENALADAVCTHRIGLRAAQHIIATDWRGAYRRFVGKLP